MGRLGNYVGTRDTKRFKTVSGGLFSLPSLIPHLHFTVLDKKAFSEQEVMSRHLGMWMTCVSAEAGTVLGGIELNLCGKFLRSRDCCRSTISKKLHRKCLGKELSVCVNILYYC
jgi:hypothetical protein